MNRRDLLSYITELRLVACNWVQISKKVGLSTKTLQRWRDEPSNLFVEPLTTPSIAVITDIVRLYILERKTRGEVMLMGHLRGPPHHIWIRMTDLRMIINSVWLCK